jgi:AbrB family looped-hinge helix DNA binding protein
MNVVTLSSKNQIVVPSIARKLMNLKPGARLYIDEVSEDKITLVKCDPVDEFYGVLKGVTDEDPVEYIRKMRDEW